MLVYKDPLRAIELRVDCAKAALPFEKPRLASFEGHVTGKVTLEQLVAEAAKPVSEG